jgi:hypothetical protein
MQAAGRIHPSDMCACDSGLVNRNAGSNEVIKRDEMARRFAASRQMRIKAATCGQTTCWEDTVTMSKPAKTEAELIAMARAELKVHVDCPDGIEIFVIRDGDSWEFRAKAEAATVAKPGYPECVAMLVQIGDHLSKQYDFKE